MRIKILIIAAISLALTSGVSQAQSNAQTVAAALQSWRDACGDPNPDLAIGYLADAVATNNIDVRKACMRQVFASDNVDLKSAALRITIAALPLVRFRVEKPAEAGRFYNTIQTGFVFSAANGDEAKGTATWFTTISNTQPEETYSGTVSVLGPGIVWQGKVRYGSGAYVCQLATDLADGAVLQGIVNCGNLGVYNITANLMD
ncbi:MAG: hypothetical protein AAFV27_04365 [Pseudomonadota bacterium]